MISMTFSNFLFQKFFHKVSERLSNPNIFIVHNRSDAFVGEDMQDEVKSQHMDRAVKFLVNELKVCQSKAEAEERIFFISAKEALHTRMQVHKFCKSRNYDNPSKGSSFCQKAIFEPIPCRDDIACGRPLIIV